MQNNSGPKRSINQLQPQNLGDSIVNWNSGMGDPSTLGASFSNSAGFVNANTGVQLSVESANSLGSLYWEKTYDYNNDLYIKMTLLGSHAAGSGGEGWTLFLGSSTNDTKLNQETGSINVFLCDNFYNEPNTDAVIIFVNGEKIGGEGANYFTSEQIDDSKARTFEVLYQHETDDVNYITVYMDGKYICKVNVGSWTPGGNYIGVTGSSSSDASLVNNHYIKSMEVRSIVPWTSVNYPTINTNKSAIFILTNEDYIDYTTDPAGSASYEANNIMAYLDDNSIVYETFTDITAAGWESVQKKAGYVIIPEMERGDILPDLSEESKNIIKNIVTFGGKLLIFNPNNGDAIGLMNDVFSFSMGEGGGTGDTISQTVVGTDLFPSESATIPSLSATSSLPTDTLPAEAVTIYEGSDGNQSVVTMIPYGDGKIYVLGWDWFNAQPLGDEDGGWLHLLLSFLQS